MEDEDNKINDLPDDTAAEAQTTESLMGAAQQLQHEPATSRVSEKKKKANQANSQFSTGPKTARGKRAVRHNSVKYGLYCRDVVITEGAAREDRADFDRLIEELIAYWQPDGIMEMDEVRAIAECKWRLRRARLAEVGEIRKASDTPLAEHIAETLDHTTGALGFIASPNGQRHGTGLDWFGRITLRQILQNIDAHVRQYGYVGDLVQRAIEREVGYDCELAQLCRMLSSQQPTEEANVKEVLLNRVENLLGALEAFAEEFDEYEARINGATRLTSLLPRKEFIVNLLKYEKANEKKMERAIQRLLKFQQRRQS